MVHYIPLHLQPVFSNEINLIGAEKYYNNCLSLPLHTNMNFSDVKRVVRNLKTNSCWLISSMKLAIGTAQFGYKYGFNSQRVVPKKNPSKTNFK